VDLATGEVYWANGLEVWKRGPLADDKAELVNRFPKELVEGRLDHLATHPTFSADGRTINLDARFVRADGSAVVCIGALPLDGSPYELWQRIEGRYFNHSLFSPTDPHVQMLAQEFWKDHAPFDHDLPYHRIWAIRRGGEVRPLLREPVSHSGHEWWDADGGHVWYVHYRIGIKKVVLETGEEALVWPGALSHGHSDATGSYLIADRMDDPVVSDCHVLFRNNLTGRTVEVVNGPPLAPQLTQCVHLHPHPQFCLGDRYICHTTTVHDRVDVSLVPVSTLLERTS
jgi:hypothetical protein